MKPTENPKVMEEVQQLCYHLVQARKDLDITQQELADKLSITRITYRKKEKGTLAFTLPEFILLNHILELYTTIGKSLFIQRGSRIERVKLKRAHELIKEVLNPSKKEEIFDEYGE